MYKGTQGHAECLVSNVVLVVVRQIGANAVSAAGSATGRDRKKNNDHRISDRGTSNVAYLQVVFVKLVGAGVQADEDKMSEQPPR